MTVIVGTILLQGLTLPYVVRWGGLDGGDEARERETRRASVKASRTALAALPELARSMNAPDELGARIRVDYEAHLADLRAEDADDRETVRYQQQEHQLRLAVLQHKRQAITQMRDANKIDDYVLRDLQASMDIEEIRLLGPNSLD